jgi:hypothetical protein
LSGGDASAAVPPWMPIQCGTMFRRPYPRRNGELLGIFKMMVRTGVLVPPSVSQGGDGDQAEMLRHTDQLWIAISSFIAVCLPPELGCTHCHVFPSLIKQNVQMALLGGFNEKHPVQSIPRTSRIESPRSYGNRCPIYEASPTALVVFVPKFLHTRSGAPV